MAPPKAARGDATLAETTRGFRYVFLLNILSKLVTFGANAFLVRHSSPLEQGIRLNVDLLVTSVMFFGREAFRNAALRINMGAERSVGEARGAFTQAINVGWASCGFTLLLLAAAQLISPHAIASSPDWAAVSADLRIQAVISLHLAGCVIESLGEPLYIAAQGMSLMKLRSTAEATALLLKILSTYAFVVLGVPPLISLGLSQVVYGGSQTLVYAWHFLRRLEGRVAEVVSGKSLLPVWRGGGAEAIPRGVREAGQQLQLEAAMRLVLTEGEKVVLSAVVALPAQGVYEVVAHLGSTVCRLLFRFVEEFSLSLWSKLIAVGAVGRSVSILEFLVRLLAILGTFFAAFGPAFSRSLLFLLYGEKWVATDAPSLLSVYCIYVALMGVNGVCEAFYRASATDIHLSRLWKVQCVFSVISVGASYLLSGVCGLGVAGLILSSGFVMCLRIVFCLRFASGFDGFDVMRCCPSPAVLVSACVSFIAACASESVLFPSAVDPLWRDMAMHIGVGVVICAGHIAVVYVAEKPLISEARSLLKSEKQE